MSFYPSGKVKLMKPFYLIALHARCSLQINNSANTNKFKSQFSELGKTR